MTGWEKYLNQPLVEQPQERSVWDNIKPFVYLAAYLGFIVICMKEWIPVWLGFAIFMLPTVGFVVCVIIALADPNWFVSNRLPRAGTKPVGQKRRA